MESPITRRHALKTIGLGATALMAGDWTQAENATDTNARLAKPLRFGIFADSHFSAWRHSPDRHQLTDDVRRHAAFLERMREWKPDFVVAVGDYVTPRLSGEHNMTREQYQGLTEDLGVFWPMLKNCGCPAYVVAGNHDVGWVQGGDEKLTTEDLIKRGSGGGHALCKDEWAQRLSMPGRYYAFDIRGVRIIVLDANNSQDSEVPNNKDGVRGAYWIDQPQLRWFEQQLRETAGRPKIIFCHQELHHTGNDGSGQGGWSPFPPFHKDGSYVGNGWLLRDLMARDGNVLACFHGHYHMNRWTVYGGTHFITLDNERGDGGQNWAEVTVTPNQLLVAGHNHQQSYDLPLPASTESQRPPAGNFEAAEQRRKEYQARRSG